MDDEAALDVLRAEAAALAAAAAEGLDRTVGTYPTWTVADLVVHTGRIHRWVAGIVRDRVTVRPPQPEIVDRLRDPIAWFRAGAVEVADTLAATAPDTPVWTFVGDPTVAFWRRRMALETTIHRWDAQDATGAPGPIMEDVAAAGVTEALEVYVEPSLRGAHVGGSGEVVGLQVPRTELRWVVQLRPDAVAIVNDGRRADVTVDAPARRLWLFLMSRAGRDVLSVDGSADAVERLERALALLPTPSR